MSRAVTGGNMEAITWLTEEYHMDVRLCNVSHYVILTYVSGTKFTLS